MTTLAKLLKENGKRLCHLADEMGVDKSTVTRWSQRRIPAERVLAIEAITGIPRQQLRPDIFEAAQ